MPVVTAASPTIGVVRISREGFRRVLRQIGAAALLAERDPGDYWAAIVALRDGRGRCVDPLLLLAILNHESSGGRAGVAVTTHSWGNTRRPSFGVDPVPGQMLRDFPVYRDWLDGAVSTAARILAPDWVYAGYGRTTIGSLYATPDDPATAEDESEQVWAPSSDGNDPGAYRDAVLAFMNRYRDQEDIVMGTQIPAPPAALIGHPVSVIPAADYGPLRSAAAIRWFVVHRTEGHRAGDIPTLTEPTPPVASVHAWIGDGGDIVMMLPITTTAWACANSAVDRVGVSVELEGFSRNPPSDAQYESLARLFRWFRDAQGMTGVPAEFVGYDDVPGIIGHMHVADPSDPGRWGGENNHTDPGATFDWGRLVRRIRELDAPPAAAKWVIPGTPGGDVGFVLGFRAWLETQARARFAADLNAGALAITGYPEGDEYQAADGCSYQVCERLVLKFQPGAAPPWDIVPMLRSAPPPPPKGGAS